MPYKLKNLIPFIVATTATGVANADINTDHFTFAGYAKMTAASEQMPGKDARQITSQLSDARLSVETNVTNEVVLYASAAHRFVREIEVGKSEIDEAYLTVAADKYVTVKAGKANIGSPDAGPADVETYVDKIAGMSHPSLGFTAKGDSLHATFAGYKREFRQEKGDQSGLAGSIGYESAPSKNSHLSASVDYNSSTLDSRYINQLRGEDALLGDSKDGGSNTLRGAVTYGPVTLDISGIHSTVKDSVGQKISAGAAVLTVRTPGISGSSVSLRAEETTGGADYLLSEKRSALSFNQQAEGSHWRWGAEVRKDVDYDGVSRTSFQFEFGAAL